MGRFWIALVSLSMCGLYQNCNGLAGFQVKEFSSTSNPIFSFKMSRPQTQILPLSIRISKIQSLLGSTDGGPLSIVNAHKMELGGYDHANGVAVDLSWTETRLSVWTKAMQPVCKSPLLAGRFPYPAAAAEFIKTAYGRNLSGGDSQLLNQVAAITADDQSRFNVLCTVVLSSLEFNSL